MSPVDLAIIGDRAWQRGRLSLAARRRRLKAKAWMIGQCGIAAGFAWWIASQLFGHPSPFFAPVAAVVCLGTSYGQRRRRVAEVTVGVAVGIGVADLLTGLVGRGSWQIAVVVMLAMAAAVLLDAGVLFITQAAVQSIIVTGLVVPGGDVSRIVDALIGGGVALVAATVVPGAPLRRPREAAARVAWELARLLRSARESADETDADHAANTLHRIRETETLLSELRAAAQEGLEVVRSSPFRRGHKDQVRSIAELVEPLDRAMRTSRVLIRRVLVSARLDETMPPDYLRLLDELTDATETIARELAENRSPEVAKAHLVEIAEATSGASEPLTLSAAVVLAQMRSLAVDLLELVGMSYAEAVSVFPPRP
ncbi:MAG: aromatic acid exporter family protein [Nocardioidaceae bacterium]|nr:aromatic acid exporter family protein [Nocardioidaceae bacterium]